MTTNPAIVLVAPQMGENIGAAARVMGNFGLSDLRIVAPRDGWPNPAADTMSAGAFEGAVSARVFNSLHDAIADLTYVLATTARPRGMEKPVFDAETGVLEMKRSGDDIVGVLFGAEATGLLNEHIALANAIMTYPVEASFSSLNLAQAVGVFAHTWATHKKVGDFESFGGVGQCAPRQDLFGMIEHFEDELEKAGFFFPPEKKPVVVQNLRNMFTRLDWTVHEVRAFRGAIKALALGRGKSRINRNDDDL